ncbi:hypothetical protein C6P97_06860 [Burkholderia multivorans]|uniref:Uncharacterized protein n=1 Tax=Burkholderia multivorans TaxID=87883 RepID=A0AB37ATF1_9BURK|nr:hypothetical protein C6P99_15275 [Burkholderia multivorans]PRE52205.1 hypothetical protein C6P97_06860 [Burkholderia multivorans]
MRALLRRFDAIRPGWHLKTVQGDSLPPNIPWRTVILARDDEDWCAGFLCPCHCGRKIEVLLIKEAKPRWDLTIDSHRRPTLHPSIHLNDGCRSHFWIRAGRIVWCK